MTLLAILPPINVWVALIWGGIATGAMTVLMQCGPLFGLSRLSLPYLCGTALSPTRRNAMALGSIVYSIMGLLLAFLYAYAFETIGQAGWLLGSLLGLMHGLFVVTVFLPVLPYIHPRMASEHDGPSPKFRLEPPGPFGLHYGYSTPAVTIAAHTLYGAILGAAYAVHAA